jgi:hypothetical protein
MLPQTEKFNAKKSGQLAYQNNSKTSNPAHQTQKARFSTGFLILCGR